MSTNDPRGHVAVLDAWFAAFNAQDIDALCELAHPSVEVIPVEPAVTAPPGTSFHGRDGLRSLLFAGFERFPQLKLGYRDPQTSGDRVTASLEFRLDDGVRPPTTRRAMCDFRIAGGRVKRVRGFEPGRSTRGGRPERARAGWLSPREREVLSLIADGRTVAEIAEDLGLSPLTVRTHIRNAKDKLHARTTAHAIAIALTQQALDL